MRQLAQTVLSDGAKINACNTSTGTSLYAVPNFQVPGGAEIPADGTAQNERHGPSKASQLKPARTN